MFAQKAKYVNLLPPKDISSSAQAVDYVNVANYQHATFFVTMGATGAVGASKNITFTKAKDTSATSATSLPIVNYWTNASAIGSSSTANDTYVKQSAVASSGNDVALTASSNNIVYVFEFDTSELGDGYDAIGVAVAATSAAAICGVSALLTGARYQQASPPSAL